MHILKWLDNNLEKVIIFIVFIFMLGVLFAQVVARYVLNNAISWAEELCLFGLVYLTYFGASLAAKHNRHIRITLLPDSLSPKNSRLINIAVNVVFFAFLVFLIYGAINMTVLAFETNQTAPASGLPRWVVVAALPVAFCLTCIRLIQSSIRLVAEYKILAAGGPVQSNAPILSIKMED